MPVELRKRKTPPAPAPAPRATKKKGAVAKAVDTVKQAADTVAAAVTETTEGVAEAVGAPPNGAAKETVAKPSKIAVGDVLKLDAFGGEIQTQDGEATTLYQLVGKSEKGVVIFTYPRASTPGCTTQACLFRDSYVNLQQAGYSVFGLSTDLPKSNATFKTKQSLQYDLLCDPKATLIAAIGLKKSPSGTTRGVFVVDKEGKVLAAEPGSPAGTLEVVKKLLGLDGKTVELEKASSSDVVTQEKGNTAGNAEQKPLITEESKEEEDHNKAEIAAEVADTAEKIDSNTVVEA